MDDSPATKGDIGELRQEVRHDIGELRQEVRHDIGELRQEMHSEIGELRQEFGELRQEVREEVAGVEGRMTETMRNIETNLLKAFYGYVETTRQRFAFIEGQSENIMTRMKVIEERVFEIEKRINLPPAA